MPKVRVRNNNIEAALRVFKKKCADTMWEVRQREFYTTPSDKRRAAKKAAIARNKRNNNDTTRRY
jgi:ribosomal protein S21